jgi:arsenate reductase
MAKQNVLFVCTGNSARSQLAEALLRHHAGDLFEVYSGGTNPRPINPLTVRVLQEASLPTDELRAKRAETFRGGMPFRYVISLSGGPSWTCVANWPNTVERLFWTFENPASTEDTDEDPLERFRDVRDQIDARIQSWVAEVRRSLSPHPTNFGGPVPASPSLAT